MSDNDLIRRCLDDRLSAEEFAATQERLRTDADFRRQYVRIADLEACFYDECAEFRTSTTQALPESRPSSAWRFLIYGAIAVTAIALLLPILNRFAVERPHIALDPNQESVEPDTRHLPQSVFTTVSNGDATDAAILVLAEGEHISELPTGKRFKPGILKLNSGYAQLEFMSGAVVGLVGPAELHINSKDSATLVSGQVTTQVPDRARGFVLNAPSAAVVDLGTEFGVRINESGAAEVEVLNGEVELSLLGDDGATLISRRLEDTSKVRVDGELQQLTEMERSNDTFLKIRPSLDTPLSVTDEYVNRVRDSNPIVYWRFQESNAPEAKNEIDERWSGKVHATATAADSIRFVNGHVLFERSDADRFLAIDEAISDLNAQPFSIEFWMRPDDLAHSTLVGIFPEHDATAQTHLGVVEIVTDTFMIHEPGAVRFLHRNPPDSSYEVGTNVFTKGICVPHQWQHIVAVQDTNSLSLYHNGQLARRVHIDAANSAGSFRLLVGQLKINNPERQFAGALDEFAVYTRSLLPAEISEHYESISSAVSSAK